jgi:hypothetical protein
MSIKVKHGEEVIEVEPDAIELPEGWGMIRPDHVPKGYFTQEALNQTVSERLKKERDKVKSSLSEDEEFQRSVLSRYGIEVGEDGKPKTGLNEEEWKRANAEKITKPYKEQLEQFKTRATTLERGQINSELLIAAGSRFDDQYVQSLTGDDDPYVLSKFAGLFGVDDNGVVALKEGDGFAIDGEGKRITPAKYFDSNADKLKFMLKDQRQRGSNFQTGSHSTPTGGLNKKSLADPKAKARQFDVWRKQGLKPLEVYNKLPDE